MRMIAHGTAYFDGSAKDSALDLMREFCSAMRSAYQGSHKHGLKNNDLKNYVKRNYMQPLNQSYIADACVMAQELVHESALFGGRKLWKNLQSGEISKEYWTQARNSQLYSRADKSHKGNRNIRISGDLSKIYVNDPSKRGAWIEGKLFVPDKFKGIDTTRYGVRLLYKQDTDTFEVRIDYEVQAPQVNASVFGKQHGVIGIDLNPNVIVLAETNADGNLLKYRQFDGQRIPYARQGKRDHDIRDIAKKVVDHAMSAGKPIVIERLIFSQKKKVEGSVKWKRTKHNFAHNKMVEAIYHRARKHGVEVIQINPAFTSELGLLKYANMYKLSRHGAAALVIARRGQFSNGKKLYKERKTFNEVFTQKANKQQDGRWTLEGRSHSSGLSVKARSWLNNMFVRTGRINGAAHGRPAQQRKAATDAITPYAGMDAAASTLTAGRELVTRVAS